MCVVIPAGGDQAKARRSEQANAIRCKGKHCSNASSDSYIMLIIIFLCGSCSWWPRRHQHHSTQPSPRRYDYAYSIAIRYRYLAEPLTRYADVNGDAMQTTAPPPSPAQAASNGDSAPQQQQQQQQQNGAADLGAMYSPTHVKIIRADGQVCTYLNNVRSINLRLAYIRVCLCVFVCVNHAR